MIIGPMSYYDYLCYFTGAVKVEKLASKISVSFGIVFFEVTANVRIPA